MTSTHETPRDLRKKLSRANSSHKALKDKYRKKQYDQKKLNNCLSAMTNNRDKWRSNCKETEKLAETLKQELYNITQERDALETQLGALESLNKKK